MDIGWLEPLLPFPRWLRSGILGGENGYEGQMGRGVLGIEAQRIGYDSGS